MSAMSPGKVGVSFESSVLTGAGGGTEGSTNGGEAGSESRTVGVRKGDEM
jgi:hypothetical protein